MDFFKEQDIARRNSRLLTLLFALAVLVLIILTNLLFLGGLLINDSSGSMQKQLQRIDWQWVLTIAAVITSVIAVVVGINWLRFAQGGRNVAEALGGRPANPATDNSYERRAQNIVQEIALAANMPVPPLFILDQERGINAFAAGLTPGDAVVAITQGAMVKLSRDELQGVIGHEFSHILNGDMRLSIRLAAMLRGITFIGDMGSLLLHSTSRRRVRPSNGKNDGAAIALMVGLGLYLIGLLGGLMAGAIKSAISKQKEYLADASAVQFTRNSQGIADALKVIGGYTPGTLVHTARAEELSHLFFGQVKHRLWSLFATHPPLGARIKRLDPSWNGEFIDRPTEYPAQAPSMADESGTVQAQRAIAAAGMVGMVGASYEQEDSNLSPDERAGTDLNTDLNIVPVQPTGTLTPGLMHDAQHPLGAMSLILGVLWHTDSNSQQLAAVRQANIRGLEHMVPRHGSELANLPHALQLPLIELCLPTLKMLSDTQYKQFRQLLLSFIRADGHIELFEWCLFQLIHHYLDPQYRRTQASRPRYKTLADVADPLTMALGTLALLSSDDADAAFTRGAAVVELPLTLPNPTSLDIRAFGQAIDQLNHCYPLIKVTILKAMTAVARFDGVVCPRELTLIKAIAAVIDCPIPNTLLAEISQ